mmetsp:Transcript_5507/g.5936  ORF Transcript_5507/g.5936 Transcript_5507/m.5936 type:complete len:122 (+) Transcript_5507:21-386(+)
MKRVEINSFVGYVGSYIFFGLFLFWVLTPESVLHKIGITSYPNRSWAVAIMAVIPITVLYLLLMYQGLHLFNTSNIDSVHQIEDRYTRVRQSEKLGPNNLPTIHDIPLPLVSKLLYYKSDD